MRGSFERGLRKLVRCSWNFGDKPIHTACGGQALPLLLSAAHCLHLPVGHQTVGGSQEILSNMHQLHVNSQEMLRFAGILLRCGHLRLERWLSR